MLAHKTHMVWRREKKANTGGLSHVLLYSSPREQCRRNALKAVIRTRRTRAALLVPAPAPAPDVVLSLMVRALRLFLPSFSSFLASPSATLATSQRLATYLEQNHLQIMYAAPPPPSGVECGRISVQRIIKSIVACFDQASAL